MTFAEKLKAARKKAGMTQEILAEKLGVSRQAITKWETERGIPDIDNMMTISTLFGISVDEFLCTIDYSYPKFHLTMHCYLCSLIGEALHLNEHEAARWLTKDELDSVKWLPADLEVVKMMLEGRWLRSEGK